MDSKISHPPERTATTAELARETARGIPCGCGACAGYSCDGHGGLHLGRYAGAAALGLLDEARMAAVPAEAPDVFTRETIIGGAR